ncbi:hypothetical protein [Marinobacterium sedimentorum]|uniref:hypothetical protein n=1 Tax=Marinobacterium sedimentorum TaxID=2927804 RepID=UPI0020C5B554|nr:hypothetical protein [Marinobacterium sedimentorum]MCP8688672.1 hypothetical protein [Marinobacterium sedimentorum]
MNKTGTTALQSYFFSNRKRLLKSGVLYPETGLIGNAHYAFSASLGFSNPGVNSSWIKDLDILKKRFKSELGKRVHTVILSSEDFLLNKSASCVTDFFKDYQIKIVVYLRRHDHWWLSAYSQAVKMKHLPPWNQGPQGFINYNLKRNKYYGDYRYLIDRWSKIVGRNNIIVRPYEPEQNQPDLAYDFLESIGARELAEQMPRMDQRENSSLTLASVQLMDIFQRIDTNPEIHKKLLDHARSFRSDDTHSLKELINPQFLLKLLDSYEKDYTYIAQEYIGRKDGRLFYEALPELDSEWKAPRWPTQAEVAQEVLKVVAAAN